VKIIDRIKTKLEKLAWQRKVETEAEYYPTIASMLEGDIIEELDIKPTKVEGVDYCYEMLPKEVLSDYEQMKKEIQEEIDANTVETKRFEGELDIAHYRVASERPTWGNPIAVNQLQRAIVGKLSQHTEATKWFIGEPKFKEIKQTIEYKPKNCLAKLVSKPRKKDIMWFLDFEFPYKALNLSWWD